MADMGNTDYHKAGLAPYGRDCDHGQHARSRDRCEDKREITRLTAQRDALREACVQALDMCDYDISADGKRERRAIISAAIAAAEEGRS